MEIINTNTSSLRTRATLTAPTINPVFIVMIILSLLTVITNTLILVAFYAERRLQTYSNQYIVNIAISDLLVGLVIMPLRGTIVIYEQGWAFGNVLGALFYGFQNIALSVSVFGVIAICFDRYIATFYPIKHFQAKSKRKAFIVNLFTWIISLSIWVPLNIVWDLLYPSNQAGNSGFQRFNALLHLEANIAVAIVRFVGPFFIISILYLRIYSQIRITGSQHLSKKFEKQMQINKIPVKTQTHSGSRTSNHVDKLNHGNKNTTDTRFIEVNLENNGGDSTNVIKDGHISVISFKETLRSAAYATTEHTNVPETPGLSAGELAMQRDSICSSESPNQRRSTGPWNAKNRPGQSPLNVKKGMKTLSFVVLAFFITWLPNFANVIIAFVSAEFYQTISTYTEVARWATYLNSLLNPIGYALAQPLFRQTIARLLRRS